MPDLLQPGDLLVFNDTRVIPARLFGQKASGGRVEILIERLLPGNEARAQIGASKSPKPGSRIALDAGGEAEVIGREGEFYRLRFHIEDSLETWLLSAGRLPLPPYIQREPGADDAERYQTVFAREVGAVAAPTAGLHFDDALLQDAARARRAISATSRCTSARARSSRCASTTCASTACTANGSTWVPELVDQIRRTRAARRPHRRRGHDGGARAGVGDA